MSDTIELRPERELERKAKVSIALDSFGSGMRACLFLAASVIGVFLVTRADFFKNTVEIRNFIIQFLENGTLYSGSPWWTYLTHMWFHGGFFHLFSNIIALVFIVWIYQKALLSTRVWLGIYLAGGVFSGAGFLLLNHNLAADYASWSGPVVNIFWEPNTPLAGASGAIFAVWGGATAAALRYRLMKDRSVTNPMGYGFWYLFLPALLQFCTDPFFSGIAGGAHILGYVCGFLLGLLPTLRIRTELVTQALEKVHLVSAEVASDGVKRIDVGLSLDFDLAHDLLARRTTAITAFGEPESIMEVLLGEFQPEQKLVCLTSDFALARSWAVASGLQLPVEEEKEVVAEN